MRLVFADDSERKKPYRQGMGHLVAFGGVMLHCDRVADVDAMIRELMKKAGFPDGEEFKWSPGSDDWMYKGLVFDERTKFFRDVCGVLNDAGADVAIALEDCSYNPANKGEKPAFDVVIMFLERIENLLRWPHDDTGIIVADKTGGGNAETTEFIDACETLLDAGTKYVKYDHIALNVLCSDSKKMRLLQAADLVTSVICAVVAGQEKYAPDVFETIRPLLRTNPVGGRCVKIQPGFIYYNLYHWIFGDRWYHDKETGQVFEMPVSFRPYPKDPNTYRAGG